MTEEILEYRLNKLEQQNETLIVSINKLTDSLPERYVDVRLYASQQDDMEARVKDLERSNNKAFWAVLCGAGSLIITLGKIVLGL